MYARNYGDENDMQSISHSEYNIPDNYRGTAFSADELPFITDAEYKPSDKSDQHTQPAACPCPFIKEEDKSCGEAEKSHKDKPKHKGILGGILSRFDNGFALDDLLIIGLILILLNGDRDGCPENRDEVIILLALLLLGT